MILDGGLATTLQAQGLPRYTPVDDWLVPHPDRVLAAHRAFVVAGAELLLAATFVLAPHRRPDWAALADRALSLARAAGPREVWASLGPASDAPDPARSWRVVAERCASADGFALETFVNADEAAAAVRAIAPLGRPICASLVLDARGTVAGRDPAEAAAALRRAGADRVGFNCAPVGAVIRAVRATAGPRWAKPSDLSLDGADALAELAADDVWVGGCCGTPPAVIARLASRLSPR